MSSGSSASGPAVSATGSGSLGFPRNVTVDPGMLPAPAQPPPRLTAYKEFNHWSSAMKAYLIGGGFWPYVVEMGYGKEPTAPSGDDPDAWDPAARTAYETLVLHREMNTTVGMELLFATLGEDACAGS